MPRFLRRATGSATRSKLFGGTVSFLQVHQGQVVPGDEELIFERNRGLVIGARLLELSVAQVEIPPI